MLKQILLWLLVLVEKIYQDLALAAWLRDLHQTKLTRVLENPPDVCVQKLAAREYAQRMIRRKSFRGSAAFEGILPYWELLTSRQKTKLLRILMRGAYGEMDTGDLVKVIDLISETFSNRVGKWDEEKFLEKICRLIHTRSGDRAHTMPSFAVDQCDLAALIKNTFLSSCYRELFAWRYLAHPAHQSPEVQAKARQFVGEYVQYMKLPPPRPAVQAATEKQ